MDELHTTDEFATSLKGLSTADLVRTAADLNQQSLVIITHLMMIADEIARRETQPAKITGDC